MRDYGVELARRQLLRQVFGQGFGGGRCGLCGKDYRDEHDGQEKARFADLDHDERIPFAKKFVNSRDADSDCTSENRSNFHAVLAATLD